MSASSEMRKFRRALQRDGFSVAKTRGGHWRFEHSAMVGPVFPPDTPSDYRGMKNLCSELKRRMRSATLID